MSQVMSRAVTSRPLLGTRPYDIFTPRVHKQTMSKSCHWIDPLDDRRWPDLVDRHPASSIFQSRGWLDALRRVYGYEPTALVKMTPGGTCTGGMLFCRVKSWM